MAPRAHLAVMFRSASQMSLVAASSVEKCPRVLMIFPDLGIDTLQGIGRVDHASYVRRKGKEGNHLRPRAAPRRHDRRKLRASGAASEVVQRLGHPFEAIRDRDEHILWQPRTFRSLKTFIQNLAPSVCSIQRPRISRRPSGHGNRQWPIVGQNGLAASAVAVIRAILGLGATGGISQAVGELTAQGPLNDRLLKPTDGGLELLVGDRPLTHELIENFGWDGRQRRFRRQIVPFAAHRHS